jgi:hypothetical protein
VLQGCSVKALEGGPSTNWEQRSSKRLFIITLDNQRITYGTTARKKKRDLEVRYEMEKGGYMFSRRLDGIFCLRHKVVSRCLTAPRQCEGKGTKDLKEGCRKSKILSSKH